MAYNTSIALVTFCIGQCMMMVLEVVTAGGSNGMELVIG